MFESRLCMTDDVEINSNLINIDNVSYELLLHETIIYYVVDIMRLIFRLKFSVIYMQLCVLIVYVCAFFSYVILKIAGPTMLRLIYR